MREPEEKNVELIKNVYTSIGQGDIPKVLSMMSDDVEIRLPGPSAIPFSGTYRGHEGFKKFATRLVENIDWEAREMEVLEFIAQGDRVVVLGNEHLTARPTGRSWMTDWVMVWTVINGKVTLLREFHETASILQAFKANSKLNN